MLHWIFYFLFFLFWVKVCFSEDKYFSCLQSLPPFMKYIYIYLEEKAYVDVDVTLSYSSQGSPVLAVFRHHYCNSKLSQANYTLISLQPPSSILWWHWLLKKILGLVLAWKSGLKVPLLPLGPSCPLQTILMNDLFGCDSPLQIAMAVWYNYFNWKRASGLSLSHHLTQEVQI